MNYLANLVVYAVLVLEFCYAAIFTQDWAVHVEGGEEAAKQIADKYGFHFQGQIIPDYYSFKHNHVMKRSIQPSIEHHEKLAGDPQVKWVEQQVVKRRVKRDKTYFNDPKWPRMWYLRRGGGLDMNVKPAWDKGYTGKGVVVTILDDGIEKDHPDLKRNYYADASYDVNDHDQDPQPRYDYTNENRHGTRCAGEVAAEADNNICSAGVAYKASIGGVRMLDGDVTDAVEAQSLGFNQDRIDIYSASWGPDDDGRTVDGPAVLAKKAFFDGINTGRNRLGSIFVWASGNGGRDHDSCSCDGYTNSIYTLSISSATENGNIPWYSEACSSTLATTYSSGSGGERQVVTTDLRKGCTETHTGTSASAPLAAGICALALQANPNLSWRDMQHIVVMTARPANLKAPDWVVNGVGRRVSHSFGYGLMDAASMVDLAQNWTSVPEQHRCEIKARISSRSVPVYGKVRVTLESDGCRRRARESVSYLEHVQSLLTLSSSRRGEVKIYLTSPAGTRSTLLQRRVRDTSTEGFNGWEFMTTHNWGETSLGTWTLEVENGDSSSATLRSWTLVMYGTATNPQSNRRDPNSPQQDMHTQPEGNEELRCKGDEILLNNYCYKDCPRSFFRTAENFTINVNGSEKMQVTAMCEQCSLVCTNCYGPGQNECLSCANGFDLAKNNTCQRKNLTGTNSDNHSWIILIVIAACTAPVAISLCLFSILQAKDHNIFCFRKKTRYIDLKTSYSGIKLGNPEQSLLDGESEDDDIEIEITDLTQNGTHKPDVIGQ